MGTRSLIRVFNDDKEICCIYQQFDGYPDGVGATLADFLASGRFVNGIRSGDSGRIFNGMGCFAAQFIAAIKDRAGGVYLYPPGSTDCGEEYVYEVRGGLLDGSPVLVSVKCIEVFANKVAYEGGIDGFVAFCASEEAA